MALYEFRRPDGSILAVHRPMHNSPGLSVVELEDGSIRAPNADDAPDTLCHRILAGVQIARPVDHFCKTPKGHRAPPVSHSLPRRKEKGDQIRKIGSHVVREHRDGTFSTKDGKPIIDSNQTRKDAESRTGFAWDPD